MKAAVLATAVLCFAPAAAWAAERGYFGFAVSVDADGVFNPTLKAVTIATVTPNSVAAKAGMVPGDQIVELEGRAIAGTKAKELQPYLQREVGQVTRIVIRKANGDVVPLSLVAAPKLPAP